MTRWSTPCVDCEKPSKNHRCGACRIRRKEAKRLASLTGAGKRRQARRDKAKRK